MELMAGPAVTGSPFRRRPRYGGVRTRPNATLPMARSGTGDQVRTPFAFLVRPVIEHAVVRAATLATSGALSGLGSCDSQEGRRGMLQAWSFIVNFGDVNFRSRSCGRSWSCCEL